MRKMDRWFDVETPRTNNGISLIEPIESRLSWQELADVSNTRTSGTSQSMDWRSSRYFINYYAMYLRDLDSSPLSLFLSLSPRNLDQNIERLESFVLAPSLRNSNVQWRESVSTIIFRRYSHSARDRTQTFLNRVVRSALYSRNLEERERERESRNIVWSVRFNEH